MWNQTRDVLKPTYNKQFTERSPDLTGSQLPVTKLKRVGFKTSLV
jgi:hypothetical protein